MQCFFMRTTKTDQIARMRRLILSRRWAFMSEGTFSLVAAGIHYQPLVQVI